MPSWWFALFAGALLATPLVAAQPAADAHGVGEILVDATGRASGGNVRAAIAEATGTVSGFTSQAKRAEIFREVLVDGFRPTGRIEGVGTPVITLRGTNAVVAIHDASHHALDVATSEATTVHYRLAPGVKATAMETGADLVTLHRENGERLGTLLLVGAAGPSPRGDSLAVAKDEVLARAVPGSRILFLGNTPLHDAIVAAATRGALAVAYVTEFDGSRVVHSKLAPTGAPVQVLTEGARGSVQARATAVTDLAHQVLAFDLAYETLPVRDASDVAVFVDGRRAPLAATPRELADGVSSGEAAYHAETGNGRASILVGLPVSDGKLTHEVRLSANAQAQTRAQAGAEERADQGGRAFGGFHHHENGKLTGDFVTALLRDGEAGVHGFTSLLARVEVFESIALHQAGAATFRAVDATTFVVDAPRADLTLVDDAFATLLLDAKGRTDATVDLAPGVVASSEGPHELRLAGPNGLSGWLTIVGAAGRAEVRPDALVVTPDGRIEIHLEPGSRAVFRAAADDYPSEDALSRATAEGRLGAQALAGVHGTKVVTTSTSYAAGALAEISPGATGALHVAYTVAGAASAFALDVRGAALAAKSASDVRVSVDGRPALPVEHVEDALAFGDAARFHVETGLDGGLRVVVDTARPEGARVLVLVESVLASAARANARTDAFGAFRVLPDGAAVGSYVSLRADREAGAVADFAMGAAGRRVFRSIAAGDAALVATGADGATTLVLESKDARYEFSDTTSALFRVAAKRDVHAALRVADDLAVVAKGDHVVELATGEGEHLGSLLLMGATGAADGASRFERAADGQVRARLAEGAQLVFRAHVGIESELSAAQRGMVNQAVAAGRVAGQVVVQTQRAASLGATATSGAADAINVAAAETEGSVTGAVTASYFTDTHVLTAATGQRVDVTVSSLNHTGRTLIVSLDRDTVPGMAKGEAEILLNGKPTRQASSYADVLDATDDDGHAEYYVLAGEAGTQVLVSIPHFSVQVVTLKERTFDASHPAFMYATVVLGLIVVAESVWLLHKGLRRAKAAPPSATPRQPAASKASVAKRAPATLLIVPPRRP